MRTADRLVDSAMMDTMPETPTCADYGIRDSATFGAYQRAIRHGGVTADKLHECLMSEATGKALSKLIGMKVSSIYDESGDWTE